jgi:hypothetical protein
MCTLVFRTAIYSGWQPVVDRGLGGGKVGSLETAGQTPNGVGEVGRNG